MLFWWFGWILWPQGSGQSVWYFFLACRQDSCLQWHGKSRGLAGDVVKCACAAVLVDTRWLCSPSSLQRPRAPPDSSVGDTRPRRSLGPRALCTNTALPYGHVCLQTVEGLSRHMWGQLFCQLLWLVSAWEFWRTLKKAMWPGMLWGWGWRKRESALLTQWGACSCSRALSADCTARWRCVTAVTAFSGRQRGGSTTLALPLSLSCT